MATKKFLDLATGLPYLWQQILGKIESHNNSEISHQNIRDEISSLTTTVSNKVDKESGKGLSTNDYTTTEKNKLAGIATGATKTIVDSALSSSSTNPVQNKVINSALAAKVETSTYENKITSIEDSISAANSELTAFKNTKGAADGIAPLNASSQIDSQYLPSYVDDVLEYDAKANFPTNGETGKIYVDTTTNLTYRWSGTTYVEISPSIALGTTSSTAFRGDYGNAAYTHAVTNKGAAFSSGLYKITTNSEGHVTATSAVTKSDLTNLGIADASLYLPLTGGTLSGLLKIANDTNYCSLAFSPGELGGVGTFLIGSALSDSYKNYFSVRSYSRSSTDYSRLSNYEQFNLPVVDADRTTNQEYRVLTTKSPVTIAQGGTGSTTASGALTNLGVLSITEAELEECCELEEVLSTVLNDNTWEQIKAVAEQGLGANYWSVGDCKEIVLNGTVGATTYTDYHIWAQIIGFNHNPIVEGEHSIHFQLGTTAQKDGIKVALCDEKKGTMISSSDQGYYVMNSSSTNTGGWNTSEMRTVQLPALFSCLPQSLQNEISETTKYTDNVGQKTGSIEANVSITQDKLFLLGEIEVFGSNIYSNDYESLYQQQYSFYSLENSKIKYSNEDTSAPCIWFLRSPCYDSSYAFCAVQEDGNGEYASSRYSCGCAPAFSL